MGYVKEWLGLERQSGYVRDFFEEANARSCLYVSAVMAALELLMIGGVLSGLFADVRSRTDAWVVQHLAAYLVMAAAASFMLVSATRYLKGRRNPAVWAAAKIVFVAASLAFGIYISYLDYSKGEQVLAFVSMTMFVSGMLVMRPAVSIPVIASTFILFYVLCATRVSASFATKVNITVTCVAVIMTSINLFRNGLSSARKAELLEEQGVCIARQSILDDVTGAANMAHFRECAEGILQDDCTDISTLVFLFLDVENFKNYNEKNGFDSGNEFLRWVAEILGREFPESLVARFGDDHFVILAESEGIQRRLSVVREEIRRLDTTIRLGLKVGAYRPETRDCRLSVACDRARYACQTLRKRFGEDFCEYSTEMEVAFKRKQYIINSIDEAVAGGYIKVFYQPVVWAKDGTLCGVEALARWIDPVHGFLSPADFIPVLEEHRLIHRLDRAVLDTVCRDLHDFHESGGGEPIPVSVNFSRIDFEAMDVVQVVEETCRRHDVSRDWLHIEITESALTEDDGLLHEAMDRFRGAGYALWLDDFGSGYSGLNVLKDYDFDMMKIDMKFLRNFGANEKAKPILRSIVGLAGQIGMQTLTEGVETAEMSEFLRSIGCERLQGYLFGKPMPKQELLAKIGDGSLKKA